jgi:transposase InsO family protein
VWGAELVALDVSLPVQSPRQGPPVSRIKELAATRVRYGYKRIHVLLRREGWPVNHKRVYRLYRREGLSLFERRPKRHRSVAHRPKAVLSRAINECWIDGLTPTEFNWCSLGPASPPITPTSNRSTAGCARSV